MPWQEVVTVELRQQFVHDALRRVVPVTELCAAYGISRKTGYKFLARYDTLGAAGLADQSRRPHRSPAALDPVLLQRLLRRTSGIRTGDRGSCSAWWGSAGPTPPGRCAPPSRAASSISAWSWPAAGPSPRLGGPTRVPMDAPNAVWTTDYKGQFKLGEGSTASPSPWLTATAGCSSPVRRSPAPSWSRPVPSSSGSFASTGCPAGSAPTTACPSLPRHSAPLRAGRLVDPPRHPARSHRARLTPAEPLPGPQTFRCPLRCYRRGCRPHGGRHDRLGQPRAALALQIGAPVEG